MLAIVAAFIVVLSACNAFAQAHAPYKMLDSGFPAEDFWPTAWIDNERVIFTGVEFNTYPCPFKDDPRCGGRGLRNAAYLWNIRENRVTKYRDRKFTDLCVQGGYISYKAHDRLEDPRSSVYEGPFGKEKKLQLDIDRGFNRISCRYYLEVPEAAKRPEHRKIVGWIRPLLEEHGWLEEEQGKNPLSSPEDPRRIVLYGKRFPGGKILDLPRTPAKGFNRGYELNYLPFRRAYLLRNLPTSTERPPSMWYLTPDGEVSKVNISPHKWFGGTYHGVLHGVFLNTDGDGPDVNSGGGYLLLSSRITKVVTGALRSVSTSPDGCRVAFIYAATRHLIGPGYQAWKEGSSGNTVRMVDLCEGGSR